MEIGDEVEAEVENEAVQGDGILAETAPAWQAWLPSIGQLRCALRLDMQGAIDGNAALCEALDAPPDAPPATSMRQGLGLIFVVALLAGFIPFVFDLLPALQAGTSVMFTQMAAQAGAMGQETRDLFAPLAAWMETVEVVAGMDPMGPGWLAAALSALGGWLNWPLNWLSTWIVYGLGMLVLAKFLGATTTLQRFFAGISYACLPLLLLGLSPIPYVGGLLALAGLILAVVASVRAVRVVAGFDTLRAFVCVVAPALIGLLVSLAVAGATAISVFRLFV